MNTTKPADDIGISHSAGPWMDTARSPEFACLRRRLRNFILPITAFFLTWYLLYVLLAAFAPGFMAIQLVGNINVGLVFGLLQFLTTFVITLSYVRYANRKLDPLSRRIRAQLEGIAR